jgi:hypothetical protein
MTNSGHADRAGIFASSLCAAHCIAGAVLAGTSGAAAFISDERVELALIAAAVLVAAFALGTGYRRHGQSLGLQLAAVAIGAFVLARTALHDHRVAEVVLASAGAASLIVAHLFNLRALRREAGCQAAFPAAAIAERNG